MRTRGILGLAACLALHSGLAAATPVATTQPAATTPLAAGCTAAHYRVVPVPLQPAAINDSGEVAGTTPQHRAAVWSRADGLHEVPLPAGFTHSEAVSLNDHGDVVGTAFDDGFKNHQAYLFTNGRTTLLPGAEARAHLISNDGTIAGEAQVPGKTKTQAVLWVSGALQPIPNCCGGSATAVDTQGQAIGVAYDDQGRYYAYRWTPSLGLERIGPGKGFSSAVAANAHGEIVIQTFPGTLLYANGQASRLALAPKTPSYAQAINDCTVIVGAFGPFSDAYRAFIWDHTTGFQDLNTLITHESGWTLESATGINNRGEIVGRGAPEGQEDGGFLLLPIRD